MKTILFTLDNYHIGGVTTSTKNYISCLDDNYQAVIIGRTDNISDPENFFPETIVYTINQPIRYNLLGKIIDAFKYLKYLHHIYQNHSIDVIHFNTTWSTLYALLHPLTWSKKRVFTFHGAYDLEIKSHERLTGSTNNNTVLKYFLKKFLQQFCLTASNEIITFSLYAKGLIKNHYGVQMEKKVTIIPGFTKSKKIPHIKSKELTIINIGRAVPRKGLDILLKAIKLAQKKIPIKLYIASPVDFYCWSNYLNIYEEENLFLSTHFLHAVDQRQKEELFKKADLFVIPSVELETFGLTVIESLSYGVPVLGSDCGAIPEILKLVDKRLIFTNSSPKKLSEKLVWFYNLSQLQKSKLKQKAITVVEKFYNQEKYKEKLLDIYK